MYRITLGKHTNTLAENVAILCAKSNGSNSKITLDDIEAFVKCQKVLLPHSYKHTIAVRINDSYLVIDENSERALDILEQEIYDDIPTLSAYERESNKDL